MHQPSYCLVDKPASVNTTSNPPSLPAWEKQREEEEKKEEEQTLKWLKVECKTRKKL